MKRPSPWQWPLPKEMQLPSVIPLPDRSTETPAGKYAAAVEAITLLCEAKRVLDNAITPGAPNDVVTITMSKKMAALLLVLTEKELEIDL